MKKLLFIFFATGLILGFGSCSHKDIPNNELALIPQPLEMAVGVGNKFYGEDENTLCVGKEATFEFMDKVLTEVAALFPDEYVHIGGDECFGFPRMRLGYVS